MPDPAIQHFFAERKEAWLKKNLSAFMQNDQVGALKERCERLFSPEQWLPNAARRAGQIRISSHPCTFSHPSARKNKNGYVTPIIASAQQAADGYLRAGNTSVQDDALGNAAALDVYKFMTLKMIDGNSLLHHIQQDSPIATRLLSIRSEHYHIMKNGFLAMTANDEENITSSKIKQVFFPVADGYHQLSILSNSGMIYELRRRVDQLRFSEKQKTLRELKRNNRFSHEGFSEIYDTTTIGYGGTKPQNISVLNNQYGGKARLLLSTPPQLKKRDIHFPVSDFFKTSIHFYDCQQPLQKLHGIFKAGLDNAIPRRNLKSGHDHRIEEILDIITQRMNALRKIAAEQYREEISQLEKHQKIWLCEQYKPQREQEEEWLNMLCDNITRWICFAYEKAIKRPIPLGTGEFFYIKHIIQTHRENLR